MVASPSVDPAAVARIFRALGDPTRRSIVERLSEGPITVSDLAEPLRISLAAVGQHLQILEESGLVRSEKIGRTRTCRVVPGGFADLERWVGERRSQWERRFDRLSELLDGEGGPDGPGGPGSGSGG